jgi:hypothetical protein
LRIFPAQGEKMPATDVEQVLANWIGQAISLPGQLAEGLDPSKWVARQFLKWWRNEGVEPPLVDAECAIQGIRSELERLGGWNNPQLGETMHELIHLSDAFSELRQVLSLTTDDSEMS